LPVRLQNPPNIDPITGEYADYGGWSWEIQQLMEDYYDYANQITVFKVGMNPLTMPNPSWWEGEGWRIGHKHSGNPYSNEEALEYLNIAEHAYELKLTWRTAQCQYGGGTGSGCQNLHIGDIQGTLSKIHGLQNNVRDAINRQLKLDTIIPESASPTPESPAPVVEQVTEKTVNYLPIIIGAIVAIVIIIVLLRRA